MYKLTPDQEKRFVANTQAAFNSWVSAAVRGKLSLIGRLRKATTYAEIKSVKQLWYCNYGKNYGKCDRILALGLISNGTMRAKKVCVRCLHVEDAIGIKNVDALENHGTILCDWPLDLTIEIEDLPSPYLFDEFENLFDPITLRQTSDVLQTQFKELCDSNTNEVLDRVYWDRKDSYSDYLKTDEWRRIRDAVMVRDKGMCQGCLKWPASEVHHKTYEHYNNGQEMAFELVSLCRDCHEKVHGR